MFVADGGRAVRALLEPTGEPFRPEMKYYEQATELGTYEMWRLQLERSELQRQYLELWNSYGELDAILSKRGPRHRITITDSVNRPDHILRDGRERKVPICWLYRCLQRRRLFRCDLRRFPQSFKRKENVANETVALRCDCRQRWRQVSR